jgi:hypothetical protein
MFTTKKIGKSFQYAFEGDDWFSKMIISGLLFLSGIGIFAINGNGMQLMRTMVKEDNTEQNPIDWNNLGENFLDGIKIWLVNLIWKLPLIAVRTFILIVNIIILIASAESESEAGMVIFFLLWFVSCSLALVYKLALSGFKPIIVGEVATYQTIQSGLNLKKIFHLAKNSFWRNVGITILSALVFFLTFIAGSQLLNVGTVLTMPYAYDLKYHLYGQSYLETYKESVAEEKEEKKEAPAKKKTTPKKTTEK